jgi:hypothetical protein
MSQNTSSAVMQQRAEAPDSLDDFPTPPWATRALIEFLEAIGCALSTQSAWEPCCNRGYMVRPMLESFDSARASDVMLYSDYIGGCTPELIDFVTTGFTEPAVDWIFANPPFNLAEEFISVARGLARVGCAMLVRGAFTEGTGRYSRLFGVRPPDFELKFTERVVMLKGRLVRVGEPDPFNLDDDGNLRDASTATSYVWLIWLREGGGDTRARWIAPCRLRLERDGDYPVYDIPRPAVACPLFDDARSSAQDQQGAA